MIFMIKVFIWIICFVIGAVVGSLLYDLHMYIIKQIIKNKKKRAAKKNDSAGEAH